MSGVSFSELILLMLIGLIVLGPERLPRVANQLGRWLGQARRMTRAMKRQLEDELNLDNQFEILPPDRTRHTPGQYVPPTPGASLPPALAEKDDTYSPAHAADEPGTGVDDEPQPAADAINDETAAAAADNEAVATADEAAPQAAERKREPV